MLNGEVALVTGASRGIGKAIALKLAGLGADIALVYAGNTEKAEETASQIRALGVRAEAFKCDVSDFGAVKTTVDEIKAKLGTVDILVNNAGITKDGLIMNMKEEAFDGVIDINLKGAFNMIRHCSPIFIRKRSGKIVNISSVAGLMGNPGQANYAASKAGLIGLTKSVARELASRGVCCNAIAPGFIQTDMTENIASDNPLMANIPLGRMGLPEEIAELAAFLVQDGANYITGEVIRIDGGLAM
ncbi:3-oxoacyl-[acyl-carrier-protein] reductase [Sporobacter termitidis DSM 10068]|uniref:3-oxoacyl-[acyl-carrier-protein] reductase n=1 Tax=Sporobacter termitidis DSM 10068 TaxID=1123282 RepID=A0A1M5X322_9FIRM|nr:3-oxoacyl-[acyl-carrier-protein] reductase [Sporobacter termitidis]SHH93992.1 3-oxoacyl-[acyl-carrier-protein] reductase [Sporobacter termitidis DSM 10068]